MNPNLHNVADLERIKELEAEVERLRAYSARADAATVRMGKKLEDCESRLMDYRLSEEDAVSGVNPSGDTLGRERDDG